jgi:hypothetical protein
MLAGLKTDCQLVDKELDRRFAGGAGELPPRVQSHLEQCERCRKLCDYLWESLPSGSVAWEPQQQRLQPRIVRTIQGSLKPVSRLRSTSMIVVQLALTFILISTAVTSMMKIEGINVMDRRQLIGISLILAAGAALLSLSLAWQMRPGSLQRVSARAAVGILAAGLVVGIVILFPWKTPEDFLMRGWRCLRAGFALAVPAVVAFGFLVRRGAVLNLGTLGGTLGATAGLLGMSILQFTCNLQDIGHLLVWHVGVVALSALAGWLIGRSVGHLRARFD